MSGAQLYVAYMIGSYVFGITSFFLIWLAILSEYGFLIAITIGWMGAAMGACFVALLWPLVALAIVGYLMIN